MDSLTAPSHAESIERLGEQLEAENFAEALLVVDEALESTPDSPPWLVAKGLLSTIVGESDSGLAELGRVSRHAGFREGLGLPTALFAKLRTQSLDRLESTATSAADRVTALRRLARCAKLLGADQREAAALQQLLGVEPEDEEAARRLSSLLDQQPVDEAISTLEKMLEQQPNSCWLRTLLARSLHRKNKTALALRHLKQAVEADPKNLQPHRELARIYIGQTRYDEAEKELATVLSGSDRPDPETLGLLATCQKETYRYDEALKTLISSLQADLESFGDWDTLVELSEATGQLENLHRFLEGAVVANPTSEPLVLRLVQLKLDSGEPLSAEHTLLQGGYLKTPTESPEVAKLGVEVLLQLGETHRALAIAEKLHQGYPSEQSTTVLLGRSYLAAGKGAEAEALFCNLARFQPNEVTYQIGWGRGLLQTGQFEKAHRTFHLASRLDPDSCEALELQALALLELGRLDEANELLKESAKKCESGRPQTMFALGRVYEVRGLTDIAHDFYRQALSKEGFPLEAIRGWLKTATDSKATSEELTELLTLPLTYFYKLRLYLGVLEVSLLHSPYPGEEQFFLSARPALLEQPGDERLLAIFLEKEKALLRELAERCESLGETEIARRVLRSAMPLGSPELEVWAAEELERLDRIEPETPSSGLATLSSPTSEIGSPVADSELTVEELFDLPLPESPPGKSDDLDPQTTPEASGLQADAAVPLGDSSPASELATAEEVFAGAEVLDGNEPEEDDPLMSLLSATIPTAPTTDPHGSEKPEGQAEEAQPGSDELAALLDATLLPPPQDESESVDTSAALKKESPSDLDPDELKGPQDLRTAPGLSVEESTTVSVLTAGIDSALSVAEKPEASKSTVGNTDSVDTQTSEVPTSTEATVPVERPTDEPTADEPAVPSQMSPPDLDRSEKSSTDSAATHLESPAAEPSDDSSIPSEPTDRKDLLDIPMAVDFEPSTRRQLHFLEAMAHRADPLMNPETIAHLLLQSAAAPTPPDPSSPEQSCPYDSAVAALFETAQRLQVEGRYRGAMSVLRTALLYAPQKPELLMLHATLSSAWAKWLEEQDEFAHAITLLREAAKRQPDSDELVGNLLETYQSWMEWTEGNGDPAARALLSLYLESEHQQLERLKAEWAERQKSWAAQQAQISTPVAVQAPTEAATDSPVETAAPDPSPAAAAATVEVTTAPPPEASSEAAPQRSPSESSTVASTASEVPSSIRPEAGATAATPAVEEPSPLPTATPAETSSDSPEQASADPVETLLDSLESAADPDAVGNELLRLFQDAPRELISKLRERSQGSSEPIWLLMLARAFRQGGSETMAAIQYQKYLKAAPSPEIYEELATTYEEIGKADFAEMTRKKAQRSFGS